MQNPNKRTVRVACVSGGGGHEHEPVPAVRLLPGAAGRLPGLRPPLLPVTQIHQAEVNAGLVKDQQTACHQSASILHILFD